MRPAPTRSTLAARDTPQEMNQGECVADRTLVYPIGEWEETYLGQSTLHGSATGPHESMLVRSTRWLPTIDATPADAGGDATPALAGASGGGHGGLRLLPATCVGHTTWTTRTDAAVEVVCRYLRCGEMIVRRTWLPASGAASGSIGTAGALHPVVCEEVFVRRA